MVRFSLDFAPGTTDDCKRLVQTEFHPNELLEAYRKGVEAYGGKDIVLVVAANDPQDIHAFPRSRYVEQALSRNSKDQLSKLTIASKSARRVMQLPADSDAFWLVIEIRQAQYPIMCVLHVTRSEVVDSTVLVTN